MFCAAKGGIKMRKNFGAKPYMYPLPVLIIGTYGEDGTPDAMNAAWGGICEADKIMLCLSDTHKTTKNILNRKAFTVSFAEAAHVVACDYVGVVSRNKEPKKFEKAGFHAIKSEFVDAPLIAELPMALECELDKVNEDGLIIGRIVNVSVDESVLGADGKADPAKFGPIAFDAVNNTYIKLGETVGKAFSDGLKLK